MHPPRLASNKLPFLRVLSALITAGVVWLGIAPLRPAEAVPAHSTAVWLRGWPMEGHDPQRTFSSPDLGPVHPSLLFARRVGASVVSADGHIYALTPKGLVALTSAGRRLWRVRECCYGNVPVIAPNGTLLGVGVNPKSTYPELWPHDPEALGIAPKGRIAWRIRPFGFPKSARPLGDERGRFYVPVSGPQGTPAQGTNVLSPQGAILHHMLTLLPYPALAHDGTLYGVTVDPDQSRMFLCAYSPSEILLWKATWDFAPVATVGPLVGLDGTVFLGSGTTLAAFTPEGGRRWTTTLPDEVLSFAQRPDGTLLVAGKQRLIAVGADGKVHWEVPIGLTPHQYSYQAPSLVSDAAGAAYVGTGDGKVSIYSAGGEQLSVIDSGGPSTGQAPRVILGPGRRLLINGDDGLLRVYGQRSEPTRRRRRLRAIPLPSLPDQARCRFMMW